MAKLKGKHRAFIVEHLACYESPSDVAERLKEEFEVEASRQQIAFYDPNSRQSNLELAQQWKDLFEITRREYLDDVKQYPIAHKGYRVGRLQEALEMAEDNEDYEGMRKLLETAAKEVGGYFVSNDQSFKKQAEGRSVYEQVNQKAIQVFGTEEEKAEAARKN